MTQVKGVPTPLPEDDAADDGGGVPMLEIRDLEVRYGTVPALRGVNLKVGAGEMVALLGVNGAGKTTTLRTVSGLMRPSAGQVFVAGEAVGGMAAHEVVARGVSHVPEGRRIFGRMTVYENLLMGAYRDRSHIRDDVAAVYELFPRLAERAGQSAGTLSGGEQQMLAIGRAMTARPRLLLLDEPSTGLAPMVVARILDTIRTVNAAGVAVLLVEQNAVAALEIASRGYVLENGTVVAADHAKALAADDRVRQAYLGQ